MDKTVPPPNTSESESRLLFSPVALTTHQDPPARGSWQSWKAFPGSGLLPLRETIL